MAPVGFESSISARCFLENEIPPKDATMSLTLVEPAAGATGIVVGSSLGALSLFAPVASMLNSNGTYLSLSPFGQSVLRTDLVTGIFTDVVVRASEM